MCPNRSAMRECKGLGVHLLISIITPVIWNEQQLYIRTFTVTGTTLDLYCLQGSGDLRMCSSQKTDRNITQILLFLDDLLMLFQAFALNLMWYISCWRGLCI